MNCCKNIIKSGIKNVIVLKKDSEPVYNEKYVKTKIKSYNGKINTNFHDNGLSKEDSHCIWLSLILVGTVFKMGKKKTFLKCF